MRILIAALAVITLSTGAEAYCYPVPESARTGYTGRDVQQTLCLQNELSQAARANAAQTEIDAALSQLQRDLQQQQLRLQQLQMLQMQNLGNPATPSLF